MTKCKQHDENGVVIFTVLAMMGALLLILSSFFATAQAALAASRNWHQQDRCLLVAQSALEKAKWDMSNAFETYFESAPLPRTMGKFDWFDTYTTTAIGSSGAYSAPRDVEYLDAKVWVTIREVRNGGRGIRDVFMSAKAVMGTSRREVVELVRFELGRSSAFDYAYFINNFGWFWGSSIQANGDVGANGDFDLRYNPRVNGDVYASENAALGAEGDVDGDWSSWSLSSYYTSVAATARPGSPPSTTYEEKWRMGYDGTPGRAEEMPTVEMPYLGDLGDYRTLADDENGSVKVGNKTLVAEVYNGPGPDTVAGTADDGMVVLVGTAAAPIVINGPVVVNGDVVIKGKVTGQGTIYASRNIHIIGNIEYVDAPQWPKPDPDPEATALANSTKDMLGLVAKGNIIVGDYTSSTWDSCKSYIRPGFTQPYDTDASEVANGYDSDGDLTNGYRFNGDYTGLDGGQKLDSAGAAAARRYFESSSDLAFKAAAPTCDITRIDAACYTNHALAGKAGTLAWNGTMVSRDEALFFSGSLKVSWDIRLGSDSPDSKGAALSMPLALRRPTTLYWREI